VIYPPSLFLAPLSSNIFFSTTSAISHFCFYPDRVATGILETMLLLEGPPFLCFLPGEQFFFFSFASLGESSTLSSSHHSMEDFSFWTFFLGAIAGVS